MFDLGAPQNIEQVALWQAGFTSTLLNEITLATSATSSGLFTDVGTFNVVGGANNLNPAQVFDLTDTTGQFVRLTINSNHGNTNATGFGEIAFEVSAVPEPSSFVCVAMGLLVVMTRRRM